MSVPMKKPPMAEMDSDAVIYFHHDDKTYAIPCKIARKYLVEPQEEERDTVSVEEVFAEMDTRFTKAGALLQGVRAREDLTQREFAKAIHVSQSNLSNMENGRRPIGKTIAKRISAAFNVDYRYFL